MEEYTTQRGDFSFMREYMDRRGGNVAVFLFLRRLNQRRQHHTDAQEITDVGEVDVEVPTDVLDVVEDAETGDQADNSQSQVHGLINQLRGSAFKHSDSPLFYFPMPNEL